MAVPVRYRNFFSDLRVGYDNGTWELKWKCRRCGKVIARNTAGAQSHLAKHVRDRERREDHKRIAELCASMVVQ